VFGTWTRLEPGGQHGVDLGFRGVGMLTAKLGQADRLAERTEVQCRPQARREDVRSVVSHVFIVGRRLAETTISEV
jgi:hypothetical protein